VLHSPTYRTTYKEFLKIDFPRIPYPDNAEAFWQLVNLGGELRTLYLMEHPILATRITQFPESGDCMVDKPEYKQGRVYINATQFFDSVPELAWNFYIGGYQPAQKWLKDRKGRILSYEDIRHYQKIIVAMVQTDRVMKEIDLILKLLD
jgi:predicted helicase